MSMVRARSLLVWTFITGLVLHLLFISLTYMKGEISTKDLGLLTGKVLGIYAVHLAVILAGIFGQQKGLARTVSRSPFNLALILSLFWNLLLLWRSIAFYFAREDRTSFLVGYLDTVSTAASFLVAGALAYFFTKETSKSPKSE